MPTKIIYVPHYTVSGNPYVDSNFIASSFSSRNGLVADTILDTSIQWTIFVKIHSGSDVSTRQKFIGCANSADCKVPTLEFRNGKVYACMPNSSGSGWLFEVDTGFTPNTNTDYWFKYGWDGNTYSVEVSTDGENYTSIYTNSSQTATYHSDSYKIIFGNDLFGNSSQIPFLGTVDMKECYFTNTSSYTKTWQAITEEVIDVSGSIFISKGYYNNGTTKIINDELVVPLSDLVQNQTVGCKNDLYMTSVNGTIAPYITSLSAPTGTFDATVKLNTPIYLNWTKEYLCNSTQITPEWSFIPKTDISTNFITSGSLTFGDNNEVSGFSSSNNMKLDRKFSVTSAQSFEISFKVKTGSSLSGIQEIFAISPPLLLRTSSSYWNLPYNTGYWHDNNENYLSTNTLYYTKVRYYPTNTSIDGTTYTGKYLYFEIYNASKELIHRYSYSLTSTFLDFQNKDAWIGSQGGTGEHWTGSIFLGEDTYIKVDGNIFWTPYSAVTACVSTQPIMQYNLASDISYWNPKPITETLADVTAKQTLAMKNNLYLTNVTETPTSSFTFCENTPATVTTYYQQPEYVWLNSSKDIILGVQEEPDEIKLELNGATNYTIAGSPTISSDYVASSFSNSNYISAGSFDFGTSSWEIGTKIHTANSINGTAWIFHSRSQDVVSLCLYFSNPDVNAGNGSTWYNGQVWIDSSIATDTDYWYKMSYNGSRYSVKRSTDGVTFTEIGYIEDSRAITSIDDLVFGQTDGGSLFTSIDLKECYIKKNGVKIWKAVSYLSIETSQNHYWDWLNNSTYYAKNTSLSISDMSGSNLTGHILVNNTPEFTYTETNGYDKETDMYTGYTVTFDDTSHTSIASVTKTGTKMRCYSWGSLSKSYIFITEAQYESGIITGDLPFFQAIDFLITLNSTNIYPSTDYTYNASTDTFTVDGSDTATYIGDFYIDLPSNN